MSGTPQGQRGQPDGGAPGAVTVQPIRNGPVCLKGPLEMLSATGETIERVNECWLCRCGASARKPYCDGSHKRLGFTADGIVR
jgi:CDGSH-type Zn-finger protein